MKKILTHLTGIVFLISILIAGACSTSTKQEAEGDQKAIPETDTITSEDFPVILDNDSKTGISMEEIVIGCKKHLVMQNESQRGPEGKKVVDSLTTEVYYGDTIYWAKEKGSKIKVRHVRIIDSLTVDTIFTCLVAKKDDEFKGALRLVIPLKVDTGKFKYEIIFEDTDHAFWCIDPYLRIKGTR